MVMVHTVVLVVHMVLAMAHIVLVIAHTVSVVVDFVLAEVLVFRFVSPFLVVQLLLLLILLNVIHTEWPKSHDIKRKLNIYIMTQANELIFYQ
jgi:hypothetical protein